MKGGTSVKVQQLQQDPIQASSSTVVPRVGPCFRIKGRLKCSCWGQLSHLEIFCYLFFPGKSICIHPNREEQIGEIILPKSSLTQRGPLIRARVRGDTWMTHRQLHHQNAHNSVGESCVRESYLHGPPNRALSLSNCLLLA